MKRQVMSGNNTALTGSLSSMFGGSSSLLLLTEAGRLCATGVGTMTGPGAHDSECSYTKDGH